MKFQRGKYIALQSVHSKKTSLFIKNQCCLRVNRLYIYTLLRNPWWTTTLTVCKMFFQKRSIIRVTLPYRRHAALGQWGPLGGWIIKVIESTPTWYNVQTYSMTSCLYHILPCIYCILPNYTMFCLMSEIFLKHNKVHSNVPCCLVADLIVQLKYALEARFPDSPKMKPQPQLLVFRNGRGTYQYGTLIRGSAIIWWVALCAYTV